MAARAPVPRPRRGATVLGGADRGEEEGVRGLAAPLHGMAARQSAEREAVERARRSAAARGPPRAAGRRRGDRDRAGVHAQARSGRHPEGGEASPRAGRRLGGSRSLHVHLREGRRRRAGGQLRRPQHSLRSARARHGRDRERIRLRRLLRALQRDLPALLGLHAPADPARRDLEAPQRVRLHARFHLPRRGRPHAPAERAARRPAGHSQPGSLAPRRWRGDRRVLDGRPRAQGWADGACLHPAEVAGAAAKPAGGRPAGAARRLRRGGRAGPGSGDHRHRQRGLGGATGAAAPRQIAQGAPGLHALRGTLPEMVRRRAAQADPAWPGQARRGGGRRRARLVPNHRRRPDGRNRPLRGKRAGEGARRRLRHDAAEGGRPHLEVAGARRAHEREVKETKMKPAARLNECGQSAWLDLIGRKLIHSGELLRMTEEDGVRGVTANPAIFEKAIVESDEYDDQLRTLIGQGKSPLEIYEAIAIEDVRSSCDVLRPMFDRLQGRDGFVSLEVSPYIARDTRATVQEAKRFWRAVERPNLFIKIPANPEGIPAIREAIAAGISINITLIFSVRVYEQVIEAYISGLEERVAKGLPISQIHSVASFFVSRVDTLVDKLVEEKGARDLLGKIAVANAKEAYQVFLKSIGTARWKALESKGGTRQRPLWASTGTKNKAYSDVLYVEPLIGRDTVNTMPLATLQAFNDHGKVEADTVIKDVDQARAQLARLSQVGIDLEKVCAELTEQGLDLFSKALDGLLHAISARAAAQTFAKKAQLRESLGRRKEDAAAGLDAVREKKIGARLWARVTALWGAENVDQTRLGWLDATKFGKDHAAEPAPFARGAAQKFRHRVLLGLGGSSIAPEGFARDLGKREGGLDLRVLDSTAPDAVRAATPGFELRKALFLVSSKSGTTTEVDAFYRYFRGQVNDGANFAAIPEPGTPLQKRAEQDRFCRTFLNRPDIGGRFSALSYFGLVPASLLGLDLNGLIE